MNFEKRNQLNIAREHLSKLVRVLDEETPGHWGFFVMLFPFGEGGRSNYASNARREDVLKVMIEFLRKNGKAEDWMKELDVE